LGKFLRGVRIGVLGGGVSSEREISLLSAKEAYRVFRKNELEVAYIDIFTSHKEKIKEHIKSYGIGLAFVALHGKFGEDGGIQGVLEELDIPYTGSLPGPSLLAMDKALSKSIFVNSGVPTPNFTVSSDKKNIPGNIKYPVVVKPRSSGSSLGVSIVFGETDLSRAFDTAFFCQDKVILEDYIEGRELTVGILEDEPLAVVEIIPKEGYFDFEAKYDQGKTNFVAPAELGDSIYKRVQEEALGAHKALGCRHFSRVDIRLGKDNIPYVLEVNSIPGLTSHSLFPMSAKVCGINFDELILKMAEVALYEYEEEETQEVKTV